MAEIEVNKTIRINVDEIDYFSAHTYNYIVELHGK